MTTSSFGDEDPMVASKPIPAGTVVKERKDEMWREAIGGKRKRKI
jgi:hypothetical protein